jgi:hypothetical protein
MAATAAEAELERAKKILRQQISAAEREEERADAAEAKLAALETALREAVEHHEKQAKVNNIPAFQILHDYHASRAAIYRKGLGDE